MKPELWRYGAKTRCEIKEVLELRDKSGMEWRNIIDHEHDLFLWRESLIGEINGVLDYWDDYEDKGEAEKYLEYLKFLHILAGGEPCGW